MCSSLSCCPGRNPKGCRHTWREGGAHPAVFIWHHKSRASLAERVSLLSSVSILMTWICEQINSISGPTPHALEGWWCQGKLAGFRTVRMIWQWAGASISRRGKGQFRSKFPEASKQHVGNFCDSSHCPPLTRPVWWT